MGRNESEGICTTSKGHQISVGKKAFPGSDTGDGHHHITSDSFYEKSRKQTTEEILLAAEK